MLVDTFSCFQTFMLLELYASRAVIHNYLCNSSSIVNKNIKALKN